jgi:hypothetical protein
MTFTFYKSRLRGCQFRLREMQEDFLSGRKTRVLSFEAWRGQATDIAGNDDGSEAGFWTDVFAMVLLIEHETLVL